MWQKSKNSNDRIWDHRKRYSVERRINFASQRLKKEGPSMQQANTRAWTSTYALPTERHSHRTSTMNHKYNQEINFNHFRTIFGGQSCAIWNLKFEKFMCHWILRKELHTMIVRINNCYAKTKAFILFGSRPMLSHTGEISPSPSSPSIPFEAHIPVSSLKPRHWGSNPSLKPQILA